MPRKKRPLNREGGKVRDASLIVIASEDTYAPKQYFSRFKTTHVDVQVYHTEDGDSSPQHVLKRLDAFLDENVTVEGDTFWLCVDRDHWPKESLESVVRHCLQKGYGVAISNPSFDLWVLLHFEQPPQGTLWNTCQDVEARMKEIFGGYSKQCCRTMAITKAGVELARQRARAMDPGGHDLIPGPMVTWVYKILDQLVAQERVVSSS